MEFIGDRFLQRRDGVVALLFLAGGLPWHSFSPPPLPPRSGLRELVKNDVLL